MSEAINETVVGPHSTETRSGISLWRALSWVLIPALLIIGVEKRMRPWVIHRENAYAGILAYPRDKHVDLIFIGVSRVEAAINSEAFDQAVMKATGK